MSKRTKKIAAVASNHVVDAPEAPEASAPEASAPEASAPEASAPEASAPKAKIPVFSYKVSTDGPKTSKESTLRGVAIAMLLKGPTKLSALVDLGQAWYEKRGSFPKSKTYTRVVELVRLIGSANGYGMNSEVVDGEVIITLDK